MSKQTQANNAQNPTPLELISTPIPRRSFLQLLGAGTAGLLMGRLLAACGSSSPDSGTAAGCGTTPNADLCYEFTSPAISGRTFKVKIDNPHGHDIPGNDGTSFSGLSGTVTMSTGSHNQHSLTYDLTSLTAVGASVTATSTLVDAHTHTVTFTRLT